MTYFIGVDPDLHHAGIAILSAPNKIHYLGVARVGREVKQEDASAEMATAFDLACIETDHFVQPDFVLGNKHIIIESQQIYPGSKVRSQDLIPLAQAAGCAMGTLNRAFSNISSTTFVKPLDWKGNIPKSSHHILIEKYIGFKEIIKYANVKKSELPHVIDAIGLALWGMVRSTLPRDPDRAEGASIRGSVLSSQRLERLRVHYQTHPAPRL